MKPLPVNLTTEDRRILDGIASETGATKSDVIRWAIRYYGIAGPWTDAPLFERTKALGDAENLVVGPLRMEAQ